MARASVSEPARVSRAPLDHVGEGRSRLAGYGAAAYHQSPRLAPLGALRDTIAASPRIAVQRRTADTAPSATTMNATGLPDRLKSGVEALSGLSLDHVRVRHGSSGPAQLNALAYARGSEIHVAPGQDRHLPHEAWHVVQQMQGRVRPTAQLAGGVPINDDRSLEREADVMGARAMRGPLAHQSAPIARTVGAPTAQRRIGVEAELSVPVSAAPVGAVNADQRIRAFLGGGVWYDTALSPMNAGFRKASDHGPVGSVIEGARGQMDLAVLANGFPGIPRLQATNVGIMEYVTAPFQVRTNAERIAFRASVTAMALDIAAVFAASVGGVTPTAAGNCLYGLPPVGDWQAFAVANGLAAGTGTAIHANILQTMNDQLYVQMTMGVQLRRMRTFLKKVGGNAHLASQAQIGDPNHASLVRLVTRDAAADAKAVLHQTFAGNDPHNRRDSDSLRGFTALLLSYLYGSYVYPQVQILKNMVAALSKTPLHVVQQEITATKRPDQWTVPERTMYQNAIFNRLVGRLTPAPFNAYWAANGHNGGLLGNWQAIWLPGVLAGVGDSFAGTPMNPGQLILGPAPADDHTIAPEDDPDSKAIIGGPGRPPARSAPNAVLSGVIPMELRFIEGRPQPGQLLALVNRGIRLVGETS